MKRLLPLVLVGALALAASSCGSGGAAITKVKPGKGAALMAEMGPSLTVIDVRTADEFASGHIDGAMNIDVEAGDFSQRIASLDHAANYMVYCHSGRRSGIASTVMADAGFQHVYDLGGVQDWVALGLPLVTD